MSKIEENFDKVLASINEVEAELRDEDGYNIIELSELVHKLEELVEELVSEVVGEELASVDVGAIDLFFDEPVNSLMKAELNKQLELREGKELSEETKNEVQTAIINFLNHVAQETEDITSNSVLEGTFYLNEDAPSLYSKVASFDQYVTDAAMEFMDLIEQKFESSAAETDEEYQLLRFYLSHHPYNTKAEVDLMSDHQVYLAFKQLTLGKAK
jgi:hypothetical protein